MRGGGPRGGALILYAGSYFRTKPHFLFISLAARMPVTVELLTWNVLMCMMTTLLVSCFIHVIIKNLNPNGRAMHVGRFICFGVKDHFIDDGQCYGPSNKTQFSYVSQVAEPMGAFLVVITKFCKFIKSSSA